MRGQSDRGYVNLLADFDGPSPVVTAEVLSLSPESFLIIRRMR
jgi:hypothetical protein